METANAVPTPFKTKKISLSSLAIFKENLVELNKAQSIAITLQKKHTDKNFPLI